MRIRRSIAGKLILYFGISLLLFALVVGGVFALLLTRQTAGLHKQELESKAVSIAGTLADFMEGKTSSSGKGKGMGEHGQSGQNGQGGHGGQGGYGAYMRFLDDIAMTDVWVMDERSRLITMGHENETIEYTDLPADAGDVVEQALSGETAFSQGFSDLLGVESLSVGAPIKGAEGAVLGVVLLHAPIDGIDTAVTNGVGLMGISMLLALLLAAIAAVLLAFHFTKPLRRMNEAANQMAAGDYQAQTNVKQADEIGELALTLDRLAVRLADAEQESEKLAKMRQDFVANISHELRTPVTVLRGSLEALCDGVVAEPDMVDGYHKQMLSDSIHLERLVNDLLELSRLQNTDFAIEKTRINLCDVMRDAAQSMERFARQKNIEIKVETAETVCAMQADYGRLRQMLLIILDNAVKFSEEGSVVTLRLDKQAEKGILSVVNHGSVIPAEELPVIFERFHKSQSAANKKGTGLGLPIAMQIAVRHDISVDVTSDEEATVFRFAAPVEL